MLINRRSSFGRIKTTALEQPVHRTQPINRAQPLSEEDDRLLERFTNEIFSATRSCTAILSCFNILQFDRTIILPIELKAHLPPNPMTLAAVQASGVADILRLETRAALSGFHYYIDSGKRLLIGHLEIDRGQMPVDFNSFRCMQVAVTTASQFALLTIKDLARLYSAFGASKWPGEMRQLAIDLDEATRGASPYFRDRKFALPTSQNDGMRSMRLQLNSEAVLAHRGRQHKVMIRDVSQEGVGLDSVTQLPAGADVTLMLPTGRELSGQVSWQDGTRAGIRLSERLPLSDPLMCA